MQRALVVIALLGATLGHARADWLADVWPQDRDPPHGDPAITLSTQGITVVLPEVSLEQARAAGLSVSSAVTAFLDRYGPRMCSDIIDMQAPHAGLRVDLHIQWERFADSPDVFYEVDPVGTDLTIDYAPTVQVRCVVPQDAIF